MTLHYKCSNCSTNLIEEKLYDGVSWKCSACKGIAVGVGLVRKISKQDWMTDLWTKAKENQTVSEKSCPTCSRKMLVGHTELSSKKIEVDICETCFLIWLDSEEFDLLKNFLPPPRLSPYNASVEKTIDRSTIDNILNTKLEDNIDLLDQYNIFMPLIALVFGFILSQINFFINITNGPRAITHEFGHAFGAWTGSMFALPTAFMQTRSDYNQSIIFGLFFHGAIIYGILRTYYFKYTFTLILLVGLFLFSIKMSLFSSDHSRIHNFIIGGIWGDILINTFMIFSFFHQISNHPRNRINRYVMLFLGSFNLMVLHKLWSDSVKDLSKLPMGSFFEGPDSPNGDLQRLFNGFGWQPQELANQTLQIVHFCLFWIVVQYFWTLREHLKNKSNGTT